MASQQTIEVWLQENRHQMLQCPNQPGDLLITRRACAKRYRSAQNVDLGGQKGRKMKSVFEEYVSANLSRCRYCPIGRDASSSG